MYQQFKFYIYTVYICPDIYYIYIIICFTVMFCAVFFFLAVILTLQTLTLLSLTLDHPN